jgi:type II secretion system protein J
MSTPFHSRSGSLQGGFTLIEILIATAASALILVAIYTMFSGAVRMRDRATEGSREARLRSRAASVIRNDLRGGIISGGSLAATLTGSRSSAETQFPGYLRFTTTTGRDSEDEQFGDIQEVEYFVAAASDPADRKSGVLVRAINRTLLAPVREVTREESLLGNVEALEIEFYDGSSWIDSWEVNESDSSLPQAIRIRIRQSAPDESSAAPPPIEILSLWNTERLGAAGSIVTSETNA